MKSGDKGENVKEFDLCKEYCIGCGLCKSELHAEMNQNDNGFWYPELEESEKTNVFLKAVCPVTDSFKKSKASGIWGDSVAIYAGYSANKDIRTKSSSGGFLTGIALFLLESKKVDGIIQIAQNIQNPIETVVRVSTTREQVLECCGSRYSISSPWLRLSECVEKGKKYAAIGKPCDIRALKRLKEYNNSYEEIIYLLSFFCAGLPSNNANKKLLTELGCVLEECKTLTYRGNGWPGYTTAVDKAGVEYKMEYSRAWGKILGREIHPYCRICLDGIGESADIACGDGWYITKDNEPDFTEHDGRNVVFSRTQKGEQLIREAVEHGIIEIEPWEDIEVLKKIQKYQYTRKATMGAKRWAYVFGGKKFPFYDRSVLKEYSGMISLKARMRVFAGTLKRIVQKRI